MKTESARCQIDGALIQVGIGPLGETVFRCVACERRRARQCQDCAQPVKGRSWRCEPCKRLAAQHATRRSERRNRDARLAAARRRYASLPPEVRREKLDRKKAWRETNLIKVMRQKRRARLKGTGGYRTREAYLAAMRHQNERRRDRKRELMRALCQERSPYRDREPCCRECGATIAWSRIGRPRLKCDSCAQRPKHCRPDPRRERSK